SLGGHALTSELVLRGVEPRRRRLLVVDHRVSDRPRHGRRPQDHPHGEREEDGGQREDVAAPGDHRNRPRTQRANEIHTTTAQTSVSWAESRATTTAAIATSAASTTTARPRPVPRER